MKRIALLVLVLCFMVSGCVTAGDVLLNDQNIKAGTYIVNTSTQPEIQQAGQDIVSNSVQLIEALGQAPADAPIYSSDFSAALRGQASEEHKNLEKIGSGIWDKVSANLPGWLSALFLGAFSLFQSVKQKITNKKSTDKVVSLVEAGESFKDKLAKIKSDGKIEPAELVDLFNSTYKDSQVAYNVWLDIKDVIDSVKKKA